MQRWFNNLPRLIQIIFLFIPGLNWIFEILIRWSAFFHHPRFGLFLLALGVTLLGPVFGLIDVVWCLLFKHLIFAPTIE